MGRRLHQGRLHLEALPGGRDSHDERRSSEDRASDCAEPFSGAYPIEKADDVRKYAQLWRISDDMWDTWSAPAAETFPGGAGAAIRSHRAVGSPTSRSDTGPTLICCHSATLAPGRVGGKARASRLTPDESRTLMTLWSMALLLRWSQAPISPYGMRQQRRFIPTWR